MPNLCSIHSNMSHNNHYSAIQESSNTPRTYQDPYQSIPLAELSPATMFSKNKNKDPVVVEQSTVAMDEEEEEMLRKGMVDWNALKKKDFWFNRGMISTSPPSPCFLCGLFCHVTYLSGTERVVYNRHIPHVRLPCSLSTSTVKELITNMASIV
jgi:hypothetical protein